jgi:hypothetical protein
MHRRLVWHGPVYVVIMERSLYWFEWMHQRPVDTCDLKPQHRCKLCCKCTLINRNIVFKFRYCIVRRGRCIDCLLDRRHSPVRRRNTLRNIPNMQPRPIRIWILLVVWEFGQLLCLPAIHRLLVRRGD